MVFRAWRPVGAQVHGDGGSLVALMAYPFNVYHCIVQLLGRQWSVFARILLEGPISGNSLATNLSRLGLGDIEFGDLEIDVVMAQPVRADACKGTRLIASHARVGPEPPSGARVKFGSAGAGKWRHDEGSRPLS